MHQVVSPPVSLHPDMSSFKNREQAADCVSHRTRPWKLVRTELQRAIFYCRVLKYSVTIQVGTNPMSHIYCPVRSSACNRCMSVTFSFHGGVRLNGYDAPSTVTGNGLYEE